MSEQNIFTNARVEIKYLFTKILHAMRRESKTTRGKLQRNAREKKQSIYN